MPLNEADTRAKLIDPAIKAVGWTEDHIKREETAGRIAIIGGKAVPRNLHAVQNPDSTPAVWRPIHPEAQGRDDGQVLPPFGGLMFASSPEHPAHCRRLALSQGPAGCGDGTRTRFPVGR